VPASALHVRDVVAGVTGQTLKNVLENVPEMLSVTVFVVSVMVTLV